MLLVHEVAEGLVLGAVIASRTRQPRIKEQRKPEISDKIVTANKKAQMSPRTLLKLSTNSLHSQDPAPMDMQGGWAKQKAREPGQEPHFQESFPQGPQLQPLSPQLLTRPGQVKANVITSDSLSQLKVPGTSQDPHVLRLAQPKNHHHDLRANPPAFSSSLFEDK